MTAGTLNLNWKQVDERTWRAEAQGLFYEIRRFDNQRSHYSAYQRFPDQAGLNMRYIVSMLDVELVKVRVQEDLDSQTKRLAKQ